MLRHSRHMVNSGHPPIRRIGNGSIIILMYITRTTITARSIIKVRRTCTIVIRRKCRFLLMIRRGSISIRCKDVIIPAIISGSIFSRRICAAGTDKHRTHKTDRSSDRYCLDATRLLGQCKITVGQYIAFPTGTIPKPTVLAKDLNDHAVNKADYKRRGLHRQQPASSRQ